MDIYQVLEMENTRIRKTLGRLLDTTAARGEERSDFIEEIRVGLLAEKEVEEKLFDLVRRSIPEDQAMDLGVRVKEALGRVRAKYLH